MFHSNAQSRVAIRPIAVADAPFLLEYWSSPSVNCVANERCNTVAEAEHLIASTHLGDIHYAACLSDTGEVIGDLFAARETNHTVDTSDTFGIGWSFNPRFQGKGFAYESATLFIETLFREFGARRLYAYVETDNLRSQKLCQRLGMRFEACFKEFVSFVKNTDGSPRYEDTCVYALLKREWEASHNP